MTANSSTVSHSGAPFRVRLRRDADKRIRAGHLWIFSNELQDGFQQIEQGGIAEVLDHHGNLLGTGTVNPHSLISVRMLSRERIAVDGAFIRSRIHRALALRARVYESPENCRILFSEADFLPGLIVDRFGDLLVLQTSTAGMERLLPLITELLIDLLNPQAIIAANDSSAREFESLPLERKLLHGEFDGTKSFRQDGIDFLADPLKGQKTGFFFDQRFNRRMFGSMIRPGMTVLDLFCYTGGFGLYALAAGAGKVLFTDASESALAICREAVRHNGWSDRAEFIKTDIFPFIKDHTDLYDAVSVDPPALVKSRTKVPAALRAYRDLNARAIALVKPGGVFATSSCSGLVQPQVWRDTLREAAIKSGVPLRILLHGAQAPDHPVLAAMPETEYLKFVIGVARLD
jgi:23S rRNA (cytosine1962-C5)-methyltransferase